MHALLTKPEWKIETERGPGWLFLRLRESHDGEATETDDLAGQICHAMQQQFAHRAVLDCNGLANLRSTLVEQLEMLHDKMEVMEATIRLCGISDHERESLADCGIENSFPIYRTREEAVMGRTCGLPR